MPKPEKPKPPDDPGQSARFLRTAKEVEADEKGDTFEKVVGAIAPVKTPRKAVAAKRPKG